MSTDTSIAITQTMATYGIRLADDAIFNGVANDCNFHCTHCETTFTKIARNLKAQGCPNCTLGLPDDHPKKNAKRSSGKSEARNFVRRVIQELTDDDIRQVINGAGKDTVEALDINDLKRATRQFLALHNTRRIVRPDKPIDIAVKSGPNPQATTKRTKATTAFIGETIPVKPELSTIDLIRNYKFPDAKDDRHRCQEVFNAIKNATVPDLLQLWAEICHTATHRIILEQSGGLNGFDALMAKLKAESLLATTN